MRARLIWLSLAMGRRAFSLRSILEGPGCSVAALHWWEAVSVPFASLRDLLACHVERSPDSPAILAPGRAPLSYGRLLAHVDDVGRTLRAAGIDRHGRVAVAMPNGPDLTAAIVAVAANAACASMNPAYSDEEFSRYF